jgi:hypothetical protein
MIGVCERLDSLDRVRIRQAALLASLKRERPDLYAQLGERFATRSQELATPKPQTKPTTKQKADADEQPLPA